MQLGANDMILALDIAFTEEIKKGDVAEHIDRLEGLLTDGVEMLSASKIFIEAQ